MNRPHLRPEPVIKALQGAFARDVPRGELLALGARKVHETGPPYDGVAMYLARAEGLRLEARTGEGAWLEQLPPDGATDDPTAGSVLSTPIVLHETMLGMIAVRSDEPDAFGAVEEASLREIANALAILL